MDKQEYKTKVGSRVRIKDDVTYMYQNARVYNEAIVRARTRDHLGYPLIFVEWDKDHWAYSGEDDGWAIEAHFDLVEDPMEDKQNDLLKALADLVQNFQGEKTEGKPEEPESEALLRNGGDKDAPTYDEVLNRAVNDALDGEAFVILVAVPEKSSRGSELIAPHVYVHSKREDAAMMLDAAMADISASNYAGLVLRLIAESRRNGSSSS